MTKMSIRQERKRKFYLDSVWLSTVDIAIPKAKRTWQLCGCFFFSDFEQCVPDEKWRDDCYCMGSCTRNVLRSLNILTNELITIIYRYYCDFWYYRWIPFAMYRFRQSVRCSKRHRNKHVISIQAKHKAKCENAIPPCVGHTKQNEFFRVNRLWKIHGEFISLPKNMFEHD